eukprot:4557300-Lingulodinium_polyedra.AAC.1
MNASTAKHQIHPHCKRAHYEAIYPWLSSSHDNSCLMQVAERDQVVHTHRIQDHRHANPIA